MIIYNKQRISNKDISLVSKSLKGNKITTGDFVQSFENAISKYLNVKYSLTCNSGTSALMMAILSLGLKKNSNVIMPSINFVAAANICKHLGYNIFFADVDKETGIMTVANVKECIKINKLKKINLIFTMHLGGFTQDIVNFSFLKKKLKCYLIEDACHAFGTQYLFNKKKIKIGSCKHSDISTFSFHALKTITTGEGGAVTTNNDKIYQELIKLRSHGMIKKKNLSYQIIMGGFNFRLSDINCALGLSQLKKIKSILAVRRKMFSLYIKKLNNYKKIIKFTNKDFYLSSCHLLLANINFSKLFINKDKFFAELKKRKIITQFHYIPIYKFKNHYQNIKLPNTEFYYKNFISLPVHCDLKISEINFVIRSIKDIINNNLR